MKKKIAILHNQIINDTPDELDVLAQRDLVTNACISLGYEVTINTVGDDIKGDIEKVKASDPDSVFNLVESIWGKGELIYFGPALLNSLQIPFTGVPLDALFITTNKVLTKKILQLHRLPTAEFYSPNELDKLNPESMYLVKPIWEEASVGITADLLFSPLEEEKMKKISNLSPSHYFIERFIDGREFNVSILAGKNGPEVLPPAEMIFSSYFDDKPKIVGYKAKWDAASEEYKQTNRSFNTVEKDSLLNKQLHKICLKCWEVFNLKGYVRIDFRVDPHDNIYILEINGNPCIAPDSGFVAATFEAGYSTEMMIKRILNDTN